MGKKRVTVATIFAGYAAECAGSAALWERTRKIIPSGINHDARRLLAEAHLAGTAKGFARA